MILVARVRVVGVLDVSRALTALPGLVDRACDEGEQRGAELVADGARVRAPRRTGLLARSTRAFPAARGWAVGASVSYFWPVVRGARGVRARPYVTDAATSVEPQVVTMFGDLVESAVERAF